mgnify:CR=1 FL=1
MPVFVPEAVIMAVQPVQQHYTFHGFNAPIVQFQEGTMGWTRGVELAEPAVYRTIDFRTNEFRGLRGGERFEPSEANPMIGYRGAFRYTREPDLLRLEHRVEAEHPRAPRRRLEEADDGDQAGRKRKDQQRSGVVEDRQRCGGDVQAGQPAAHRQSALAQRQPPPPPDMLRFVDGPHAPLAHHTEHPVPLTEDDTAAQHDEPIASGHVFAGRELAPVGPDRRRVGGEPGRREAATRDRIEQKQLDSDPGSAFGRPG